MKIIINDNNDVGFYQAFLLMVVVPMSTMSSIRDSNGNEGQQLPLVSLK